MPNASYGSRSQAAKTSFSSGAFSTSTLSLAPEFSLLAIYHFSYLRYAIMSRAFACPQASQAAKEIRGRSFSGEAMEEALHTRLKRGCAEPNTDHSLRSVRSMGSIEGQGHVRWECEMSDLWLKKDPEPAPIYVQKKERRQAGIPRERVIVGCIQLLPGRFLTFGAHTNWPIPSIYVLSRSPLSIDIRLV